MGLVIDRTGMHFDATRPSDLETLLARHPLDNTALLDRARDVMARMVEATCPNTAPWTHRWSRPPRASSLIVDQTRGDASIRLGEANADSFAEMLTWARQDHPDATLVIKTHPETQAGHREGHFDRGTLPAGVVIEDRPISPYRLSSTRARSTPSPASWASRRSSQGTAPSPSACRSTRAGA
jgi:capsular polysaccharide export protein